VPDTKFFIDCGLVVVK